MVTLNTLLLACLIVALVASVATVAFFLLLGSYLGVKEIKQVTKNEDENEGGVFTIPMSALGGMGGRPVTQADIDQARAAITQHRAGPGGACGDEKKAEYVPNEGTYL